MSENGLRVQDLRLNAGLTQQQLAADVGVSVGTIRHIEQHPDDASVSLVTLHRIARALNVPTSRLFTAPRTVRITAPKPDMTAFERLLNPQPVEDGPVTLQGLRDGLKRALALHRGDEYENFIAFTPGLISRAKVVIEETSGDERREAQRILSRTYSTTTGTMILLGESDLSRRATELAQEAAEEAGDVTLAALAASTGLWLMLREARFDEVAQIADRLSADIAPSFGGEVNPKRIFTYGWLQLQLAGACTRDHRPKEADKAMRRARGAADLLGREYLDDRASFGPNVVAMHDVEQLIMMERFKEALPASRRVSKETPLSKTHQHQLSRHLLDVANANTENNNTDKALEIMSSLKRDASGWLRRQPYAETIVTKLRAKRKRKFPAELRELSTFFGIAV